jgi:hypothetical protein
MLRSLSSAVHGPLGGLHAPVAGARGYSNMGDEDASAGEDDFDEKEEMLHSHGTKMMVTSVFSNTLFSRGCHDTGKYPIQYSLIFERLSHYG